MNAVPGMSMRRVEKHNALVFIVDINLKSNKRDTVEKFRLHPLVVLFL